MKILNLKKRIILAFSISFIFSCGVANAQGLDKEGTSSIVIAEDVNAAELKFIDENRSSVESSILSTFAGQSDDSSGQLANALSNASTKELQAAQYATDMEELNLILGGSPSKNSNNAQRNLARVGDLDKEYVFTPVAPCRVVDTRNTGGFFGLNEMREYFLYGTDMSTQGGANTGCNSPVGEPRGAMISMVAVPVSGGGTFTAYPANETAPTRGSLLNYQFGEQAIVSATSVRTFYNIGQKELEVKNRFGRSHLVIDVLGYFSAPDTPAGIEYSTASSTNQGSLTSTDETVNSITVNMPSDGHCVINSSGYFLIGSATGRGRCGLTDGAVTLPSGHFIQGNGADGSRIPFGLTRGFAQSQGSTTYRLVCDEASPDAGVYNTHITAMCSSNKH